jgi:hypothetical protein
MGRRIEVGADVGVKVEAGDVERSAVTNAREGAQLRERVAWEDRGRRGEGEREVFDEAHRSRR